MLNLFKSGLDIICIYKYIRFDILEMSTQCMSYAYFIKYKVSFIKFVTGHSDIKWT